MISFLVIWTKSIIKIVMMKLWDVLRFSVTGLNHTGPVLY